MALKISVCLTGQQRLRYWEGEPDSQALIELNVLVGLFMFNSFKSVPWPEELRYPLAEAYTQWLCETVILTQLNLKKKAN